MAVDVSAPLPDLSLRDQSILTVDTGDAGSLITSLVIHVSQEAPDSLDVSSGPFQLVPGVPTVGNAGDGGSVHGGQ